MKSSLLVLCLLITTASLAAAVDAPSIQRGKELFNSTALGTNGKSCASCHLDGRNLNQVANKGEATLADIINSCIIGPLKGQGFASGSSDLKSLVMYLQTFGNTRK